MSSNHNHSKETDVLIETQGYDDHFHDHHEGDKFQTNFIFKYIFSMDHKIIARQFLFTGMFWAVIGAAMSISGYSLDFPMKALPG
mgnify:CR=1 FL=1